MSTLAKFTVVQYDRMVASGAFSGRNHRRIELIHGELREMNPIGGRHAAAVSRMNRWSTGHMPGDKVDVRVQSPIVLTELDSEPEPDLVWADVRDYGDGNPTAKDVLLLIEVSDSTLDYDQDEKADLYAAGGIQDYWIVNLVDHTIEVRREPAANGYHSVESFGAGEVVRPLAAPEVSLAVDSVFA